MYLFFEPALLHPHLEHLLHHHRRVRLCPAQRQAWEHRGPFESSPPSLQLRVGSLVLLLEGGELSVPLLQTGNRLKECELLTSETGLLIYEPMNLK
jgi:hypothetical protein